jgi:hypothetical protein
MFLANIARCGDTATWKRTDSAILRVNDQPPKEWNVYREGKKTNALILQVGDRLLLIDIHGQQVRELDSASVKRTEDSIMTQAKNPPAKALATSNWILRDVGPALRIHFELTAETYKVDLEIPQWINRGITY